MCRDVINRQHGDVMPSSCLVKRCYGISIYIWLGVTYTAYQSIWIAWSVSLYHYSSMHEHDSICCS